MFLFKNHSFQYIFLFKLYLIWKKLFSFLSADMLITNYILLFLA